MKKVVICSLASLLVGAFVGYLIGNHSFPSSALSGDISKVQRFKKDVVNENSHILLDRLKNDSEFYNSTIATLEMLSNNSKTYCAALAIAAEASKGIEALAQERDKILNHSKSMTIIYNQALNLRKNKPSAEELHNIIESNFLSAAIYTTKECTDALASFCIESQKLNNTGFLSAAAQVTSGVVLANAIADENIKLFAQCEKAGLLNHTIDGVSLNNKAYETQLNNAIKSVEAIMGQAVFKEALQNLNDISQEVLHSNISINKENLEFTSTTDITQLSFVKEQKALQNSVSSLSLLNLE